MDWWIFGGVLVFKVLKAFISDSTVKIVWSGVKPARVQQYTPYIMLYARYGWIIHRIMLICSSTLDLNSVLFSLDKAILVFWFSFGKGSRKHVIW